MGKLLKIIITLGILLFIVGIVYVYINIDYVIKYNDKKIDNIVVNLEDEVYDNSIEIEEKDLVVENKVDEIKNDNLNFFENKVENAINIENNIVTNQLENTLSNSVS